MAQPFHLSMCSLFALGSMLATSAPLAAQDQVLPWLSGSWVADAFGGELHERWVPGTGGSMVKAEGYFIMDGDTTYSESVVIGDLGGTTYLIAHPSTGGVLVWEASEAEGDMMWFENPSNSNPRRIEYVRGSPGTFTRTLYRLEDGQEVPTELLFRRR